MEEKLAVSSIAWNQNQENDVAKLLKKFNVSYVEIAPTKVWIEKIKNDPESISSSEISEYQNFWKKYDIKPIAMQSMLFLRPDLLLFDQKTTDSAVIYLKKFIKLAGRLGVKKMVFGSPKNRLINENMAMSENLKLAIEIFSELGQSALKEGIVFCIEPNPKEYNCNFITNSRQGRNLVKKVNSPGFKLHLDSAGMTLANENLTSEIIKSKNYLEHFHVSEPYLEPVKDNLKVNHEEIFKALKEINYNKIISIEMKPDIDNSKNIINLKNAINFSRKVYRISL